MTRNKWAGGHGDDSTQNYIEYMLRGSELMQKEIGAYIRIQLSRELNKLKNIFFVILFFSTFASNDFKVELGNETLYIIEVLQREIPKEKIENLSENNNGIHY